MTELNHRELAAVLAALRYWQRSDSSDTEAESDIATDGGMIDALQFDEIDDLCQRLIGGDRRRARRGDRVIGWTHANQEAALRDGWGIFDNSDHGKRIERHDEAQRFDCDAAAIAYVAVLAMRGHKLASKAVVEIAFHHAVLDAANAEPV